MAVVAWDCADDAYRERAYNHMAADIERLEAIIADQRGLERDLTATLEKRNAEIKRLVIQIAVAERAMQDMIEVGNKADAEIERLRAVLLNIQSLAERGFPIDSSKLATRCRKALASEQKA